MTLGDQNHDEQTTRALGMADHSHALASPTFAVTDDAVRIEHRFGRPLWFNVKFAWPTLPSRTSPDVGCCLTLIDALDWQLGVWKAVIGALAGRFF